MIELLDARFDKAVLEIKKDEGFSGLPYDDTLNNPTIGFGTKLPLTKSEALVLLRIRLSQMMDRLQGKRPVLKHLPIEAQNIIANMCYQLGDSGVDKFGLMWAALEKWDFEKASLEMIGSKWHEQTPERCERLAAQMFALGEKYAS